MTNTALRQQSRTGTHVKLPDFYVVTKLGLRGIRMLAKFKQ